MFSFGTSKIEEFEQLDETSKMAKKGKNTKWYPISKRVANLITQVSKLTQDVLVVEQVFGHEGLKSIYKINKIEIKDNQDKIIFVE